MVKKRTEAKHIRSLNISGC